MPFQHETRRGMRMGGQKYRLGVGLKPYPMDIGSDDLIERVRVCLSTGSGLNPIPYTLSPCIRPASPPKSW